MQGHGKHPVVAKVHQTPREAAAAWLGVLLMFLVFCIPTMNGIILAYFTKQLQQDVGITIAQYGLLTGAAVHILALHPSTHASGLWRYWGSTACALHLFRPILSPQLGEHELLPALFLHTMLEHCLRGSSRWCSTCPHGVSMLRAQAMPMGW